MIMDIQAKFVIKNDKMASMELSWEEALEVFVELSRYFDCQALEKKHEYLTRQKHEPDPLQGNAPLSISRT